MPELVWDLIRVDLGEDRPFATWPHSLLTVAEEVLVNQQKGDPDHAYKLVRRTYHGRM